jgi:hypothetical protein
MSADADHEVIDSPEALFRHLYEAHHVEEALDLDPETAPVHFWVRRHAELEREARSLRRPPHPPPQDPPPPARIPPPAGREGRRPAAFGDPLIEAVARTLAGRGHDEATVRGAIRAYASPAGGRTGEAAVRADLLEPMLRAAAERLLGAAERPAKPARATPAPAATPQEEDRRQEARREEARHEQARHQEDRRQEARREERRPDATRPDATRPEAAWAGLWADLGAPAPRRDGPAAAAGADDDIMAIADAVQRRRRRRTQRR